MPEARPAVADGELATRRRPDVHAVCVELLVAREGAAAGHELLDVAHLEPEDLRERAEPLEAVLVVEDGLPYWESKRGLTIDGKQARLT